MEGTESTHNTKISDSAYSNSCSNSQSQRSGSSSKSRQSNSSGSSFNSSGYGGKQQKPNIERGAIPQPLSKRSSKDRKKKKLKSVIQVGSSINDDTQANASTESKGDDEITENATEEKNEKQELVTESSSHTSVENNIPPASSPILKKSIDEDLKTQNVDGITDIGAINQTDQNQATKVEKGGPVEEGFCCVMSMHDGVVLYTTPSLSAVLGFPRDMWLGRSFIDFVHPKDRPTFASQITSGVALTEANSNFKDTKHSLFVMIRRYRGLKSCGYGITSKSVSYEPFKLTLTFREAPDENWISTEHVQCRSTPTVNSSMLLVISATPVKSVYKTSDEVFTAQRENMKFTTRHTATGILSHVDGTAHLLGFLPQDMLSRNIMDFYHPDDMLLLKEVYETIMVKGQGASFCGKPYRFLTHNGYYITVETEWSIFVNPWSHHLEFVIGHHRVLRGPSNPNVLLAASTTETQSQFPESTLNECKIIREEILKLLSEPVIRPNDTVKQQVSKRCQALASFMETLMDEVTKSGSRADLKLDLPQESDLTFSERDSVMLIGEISPHHDYFDSKSSSETPPSYNQLNYNENLQRFFDSRPVTVIEPDMKMDQTDTEAETRTNLSPTQCFGESGGSESAGNMSSASNANMESITNTSTGTSNGSYIPPALTEALLCKHNEDMEKMIIKRHKVSRTNKGEKSKKNQDPHIQHGVKRSGSHSWEGGEIHKTSKQQHIVESQKSTVTPFPNQTNPQPFQNANVDLWPPFSVSLTTIQSTHTTAHATHFATSSIFPTVYYIPQNISPQDQQHGQIPLQYMPHSVLYHTLYPHPSTFYHQMQFQPAPVSQGISESIYNAATFQFDKSNLGILQKIPTPSGSQNQTFQRPPSQATSVKADMGSTSASVVNRALSETSKKGGQLDSPAIDTTIDNRNNDKTTSGTTGTSEDESSHSSFYSSFLKTDEGPTSSNEGRNEKDKYDSMKDEMQWEKGPKIPVKRPNPHWLENINLTNELIYRYQVNSKVLADVLNEDMYTLKNVHQPDLVNDQLHQLYLDLELEGLSAKLSLESTSSSASSGEENLNSMKQRRKKFQYNKLVLVYEENCPLPD
ncbi:hypothetical protein PVAND_001821 [Polypedilum vanderplanki]|uniref:Period circadian protein n=1 Tax=Polypedilum vanderplanki TaxID=319348 RepID=A0A9J6BPJ9_POLVA|nr:hypothetical protein PVAND_001821 [Polypedilum vanderplanki]